MGGTIVDPKIIPGGITDRMCGLWPFYWLLSPLEPGASSYADHSDGHSIIGNNRNLNGQYKRVMAKHEKLWADPAGKTWDYWERRCVSGPPTEDGGVRTLVKWLPSHVGVIGKEIDDALKNDERTQPQPQKPSTLSDVRSVLRRSTVELWSAAPLSND
ncbi:hypothetical protein PoB_004609200 [Plakobranchus ocellatus]|uniref:Uncharacterized protein n=1 Tax=Plakobranchus ocellatus TaxID=259542 RepID=A0AAV4BJL7_9GAST|nr:hypothetical protein PoB_004609200 [Plakobranchus ocellatus]